MPQQQQSSEASIPPICAIPHPSGEAILCNRRLGPDTWCEEILAFRTSLSFSPGEQDVDGPAHYLVFLDNGFVQDGRGVWRESPKARARERWAGPTAFNHPGLGGGNSTRGPRSYPAWIQCPKCRNKRLLDASVLDVVTVGTYKALRGERRER